MYKYLVVFSMCIFHIRHGFCSLACKPKVAVIGAGIGGASASHFLTQLFNKNLDIDVFEPNEIGGRLATIQVGNDEFEAGGSIIHPRNKYMVNFVKMLNLEHRPPSGSRFGIWNGNELVFEESTWDSVTLMKLLYRYGMQPIHLHRYVNSILDDFEKIYEHQDKGVGFHNVTTLIGSMNEDFVNLLDVPIYDHLISLGYGEKLIKELVEATIVVNYGQDVNVPAFVACVSVAGAGFDLWSVKGGNKKVPQLLLSSNEKVTIIPSAVTKIYRLSAENGPKYEISYTKENAKNETSDIYDIVIIATPMVKNHKDVITFSGFENSNLQFSGELQTTIATFVSGNVNYSYFGLEDELGGIMSCDPNKTRISSIGELSTVEGKKSTDSKVWKIFSRQELNDTKQMFLQFDDVKEIKWKAYPKYCSAKWLDKFKLDDFMYYVNAIEWAASAMEMSAIGGRNAAILAFNDFQKKCSLTTTFKETVDQETQRHSAEL